MRKISYLFLSLFCTMLMITSCNASANPPGQTSITSRSVTSLSQIESTLGDLSKSESVSSSSAINSQISITRSVAAVSTAATTKYLTVSVIDVGQGDSILIQAPNGKTMLIDAGESTAQSAIYSYLKSKNVKTIDVLVATHPHADHIGSMSYIVNNFTVGSIYMPKATTTTKTYENLLLDIKNKGLSIHTAKAGTNISLDSSLQISIVAPVGSDYSNLNDYSAVIKIVYNNNSFLLAGDASNVSEQEILNSGVNINVDVLKVGHHGSSTSSSTPFLNAVSPKYAVISVGAGNSYGHPTQDALNRLTACGVKTYRTDKNGSVVFKSDGKSITISCKTSTTAISSSKSSSIVSTVKPTIAASTTNDDPIVYITNTGEKYHSAGCQYLSKSKIPISLSDAKAEGYTPCSRCHPPQ